MAKTTNKTVATTKKESLPAKAGAFAAYAGAGMENTTAEDYAIPFFNILQKGSPQVDEASGKALKGAKAGMIFETVSQKMHDGKTGVILVPCAYRRVFLRWGPRGSNTAGFKGAVPPEEVAKMRTQDLIGDLDGRTYFKMNGEISDKKCDRLSDTREHYCLLADFENDKFTPGVLSLTSTQIKKSKHLMAALADLKIDGGAGKVTPPTFYSHVRLTTVPEQNDKGNWYGVHFGLEGHFDSPEDAGFQAGLAFKETVMKNAVKVDYSQVGDDDQPGDGSGKKGF